MTVQMKKTPVKAARLARVIADDIVLYNIERVENAIRNDTVFEGLDDLLLEGRDSFERQVLPDLLASSNFFDTAIVDVILYRKRSIESFIWE